MIAAGKLIFLALAFAGKRAPGGGDGPSPPPFPSRPSPNVIPSIEPGPGDVPIAPVWPIAPPADLPPFPGTGWEYDEPVSAAVVQRAGQLVPELYAPGKGLGSYTIEFTAGHYVAYHAERMANGKNGVAAWRVRAGARSTIEPARGGPVAPSAPPAVNVVQPGRSSPPSPAPVPAPPGTPPGLFTPAVDVVPINPAAGAMSPRDAQAALNKLGFGPLAEDGVIGPQTRTAISAFQRANPPLVVDGIVGPQTKSVLLARLAGQQGSPVVLQPSAPGSVSTPRDVQHALNLLGFGPLTEDGIWGAKTAAATRVFQKSAGLVVDGVAGPKTKAALTSAVARRA